VCVCVCVCVCVVCVCALSFPPMPLWLPLHPVSLPPGCVRVLHFSILRQLSSIQATSFRIMSLCDRLWDKEGLFVMEGSKEGRNCMINLMWWPSFFACCISVGAAVWSSPDFSPFPPNSKTPIRFPSLASFLPFFPFPPMLECTSALLCLQVAASASTLVRLLCSSASPSPPQTKPYRSIEGKGRKRSVRFFVCLFAACLSACVPVLVPLFSFPASLPCC